MASKQKLINAFGKIKKSKWLADAKNWKQTLQWLGYSQQIALYILEHLEKKGISQKAFAKALGVTPQLVSKWLKGNENFTLETISRIERVLEINIIRIEAKQAETPLFKEELSVMKSAYEKPEKIHYSRQKLPAKVIQMKNKYSEDFTYDTSERNTISYS